MTKNVTMLSRATLFLTKSRYKMLCCVIVYKIYNRQAAKQEFTTSQLHYVILPSCLNLFTSQSN